MARHYFDDAIASFRAYKKLAEKALDQLNDEEYFVTLDEESNSTAAFMKHMAGNMFTRWTDFLTSDGEKPDRNRDMEFVIEPQTTKDDLLSYWERGWSCVFNAIEPLQPEDFEKKVLIRGIGPSLADSGVPTPLADPTLTLFDNSGTVQKGNDDWKSSPDAAEIMSTGIAPNS